MSTQESQGNAPVLSAREVEDAIDQDSLRLRLPFKPEFMGAEPWQDDSGQVFSGPVVMGFADLERLLANAVFHEVRVETVSRAICLPDTMIFARMNAMALVGMSPGAATLSEDERVRFIDTIATESLAVLSPFAEGDSLAFVLSTNLASARGSASV